jgi:SAM-dependent methyltransferase
VDAGCGLKAEFADLFPNNKVYSYDLSNAGDNRIIVQDISHLPLHNDKSVDIVIQSQAWECLNFNDYVKEAYRILKDDGRLYIVQSKKDWDKSKVKFENAVINNNFKVENIKVKNKKNYITLSKFK